MWQFNWGVFWAMFVVSIVMLSFILGAGAAPILKSLDEIKSTLESIRNEEADENESD